LTKVGFSENVLTNPASPLHNNRPSAARRIGDFDDTFRYDLAGDEAKLRY
jgi:hypothetical protein